MGNETEEYPTRRRYEQGQCRVPATSEEADAFADSVVKVASRRFSKITGAARHREVLIGTTQNQQRGKQTAISSISAKSQQNQKPSSSNKKDEQRLQLRCTVCERMGDSEETCCKKHPELRPLRKDSAKSWTKGDGRKPQWPGDQQPSRASRRRRSHHSQRRDDSRRPKLSRENDVSQSKAVVPVTTASISSQLAKPQASTQLKNEQDFHNSETL